MLGLDTYWSLDLLLGDPASVGWSAIETANALTGWKPEGMLLNYQDLGASPFYFAGGVPVLSSRVPSYPVTPAEIAQQIVDLRSLSDSERPLVNFFAATVWSSSFDSLAAALVPLRDDGVRFLTPRQAWRCIAAADCTR